MGFLVNASSGTSSPTYTQVCNCSNLTARTYRQNSRSGEDFLEAKRGSLELTSADRLEMNIRNLRLWRSRAAVELDELREAAASTPRRTERVRAEVDDAGLLAKTAEARARRLSAQVGDNRSAEDGLRPVERAHQGGRSLDPRQGVVDKIRASIAAAEQRMLRTLTDRMHDKIDVGFAQ